MYIVFPLIFYFVKYFAIFLTIFNLYIKYSNVILYYIYNNFNVKDCIALLIYKYKLKEFFIKKIKKLVYILLKLYINKISI